MRRLQKWIQVLSIVTLSLGSLSQLSLGAALEQRLTDTSKFKVIIKDSHSKTMIYTQNGRYYMGQPMPSGEPVQQRQISPKELIVKYQNIPTLKQSGYDALSQTAKSLSAQARMLNPTLGLALVKLPTDQSYFKSMEKLREQQSVVYAEPNYIVRAQSTPNDPYYTQQWGLPAIQAEKAWDYVPASQRANVTIAVLDTGINKTHEDLQSSIVPGYDFVNNDSDPDDHQGHGTHVAAIAAGIANNGKGIAGVASGSKIMPIKVLGDNGSGSYATIITGIKYAADHGAKVINLSLGSDGTSSAMQEAVNYAVGRGVSVVAASGNANGPVMFPANNIGVISVGATDSSSNRAYYSNFGPELDVVAPGSNITSAFINGNSSYTAMSGTSMATPVVSGVVALVRAVNPSLTPDAVTQIIRQSATDKGTSGFDNYYGYGLVNVLKAVQMAAGNPATPAPAPNPTPVPAPSTPVNPLPATNLALHHKVTVSSTAGSNYQAGYGVDGNSATRWASAAGSTPQWINVDLGKTTTITKLVLKWEKSYAKAYQIQLSNDGINWTTVYSTSTGVGGTTTLTGMVNGRYVGINATTPGTANGYSLWEFEVYGQ